MGGQKLVHELFVPGMRERPVYVFEVHFLDLAVAEAFPTYDADCVGAVVVGDAGVVLHTT